MFNAIERASRSALAFATAMLLLWTPPAVSEEPGAPPAGPSASGPGSSPGTALTERVPYIGDRGQARFQEYLGRPLPRAFAISESGAFGIGSGALPRDPRGPLDVRERALQHCREHTRGGAECVLYAVDNEIVFKKTAVAASFGPSPAGGPVPASPGPSSIAPTSSAPNAPPPSAALPAAAPRPQKVHFAGNFVVDHQFNSIAKVTFSDGSSSTLGDALLGLNAGAEYALTPDGRYEVQALAGVLFGRINATNGDASFYEFPLEVTAHVNLASLRLGAGPVLHLAPRMRGTGFASNADLDFATTLGAVGRAEYRFNSRFGLALHFHWLRLSANGSSMDASRLGGALGFYY